MPTQKQEAPKITVYARVLSNIDNSQLEGYIDVREKVGNFNFGAINGITGGQSSNIVEFDIWNNEPAFSAGMLALNNADATNCTFTAWNNSACASDSNLKDINGDYYVRARSLTDNNYSKEFYQIGGKNGLPSSEMIGNVSLSPGVLSGRVGGDHVKIQTKIVVPAASGLVDITQFVFAFQYNFE